MAPMKCAVCNDACLVASSYRLGDLDGDVCPDCQRSLAEAVRSWAVRRTREIAHVRRQRLEHAKQSARVERELYPRGLKLVGVRQ